MTDIRMTELDTPDPTTYSDTRESLGRAGVSEY